MMIYINDVNKPHYKYDDVVALAVKAGIEPKRAYIYLASLGVSGSLARIMSDSGLDYLKPVKVAVIDSNKLVTKVSICKNCKGLLIL